MSEPIVAELASQLRNPGAAHVVGVDQLDHALVGFRGRDQRSRAFNLLRSQIVRAAAQGSRLIGLTSSTPQVGKTFVSCNLAASLSRIPDLTTNIFDFDLRRGSVAERFGIPKAPGLADYLTGDVASIAGMAWAVEGEKLTIYPTFERALHSSELIASSRFNALVAAMRSASDATIHICDLPPVFANDDAMIACEQLDGYILVVEDGVTTAKQLKDAMRLLGPARCLGTILNRYIQGLAPGDYGFGYGKQGAYSTYYN